MTTTTDSLGAETPEGADGRLSLALLWRTCREMLWTSGGRTWPAFLAMTHVLAANQVLINSPLVAGHFGLILIIVGQAAFALTLAAATRSMLGVRRPWSPSLRFGVFVAMGAALGTACAIVSVILTASVATEVSRMSVGMVSLSGLGFVLALVALVLALNGLWFLHALWLVGWLVGDDTITYGNSLKRMWRATGVALGLYSLAFLNCGMLANRVAVFVVQRLGVPVNGQCLVVVAETALNLVFVAIGAALWRLRNVARLQVDIFD